MQLSRKRIIKVIATYYICGFKSGLGFRVSVIILIFITSMMGASTILSVTSCHDKALGFERKV